MTSKWRSLTVISACEKGRRRQQTLRTCQIVKPLCLFTSSIFIIFTSSISILFLLTLLLFSLKHDVTASETSKYSPHGEVIKFVSSSIARLGPVSSCLQLLKSVCFCFQDSLVEPERFRKGGGLAPLSPISSSIVIFTANKARARRAVKRNDPLQKKSRGVHQLD